MRTSFLTLALVALVGCGEDGSFNPDHSEPDSVPTKVDTDEPASSCNTPNGPQEDTSGSRDPMAEAPGLDHMPAAVRGKEPIESANPDKELDLRVHLAMRNEDQLEQLIEDQNDPKSPRYHHYLTPDEFAARFFPTPEQVDAAKEWLTAQGFEVGEPYAAIIPAKSTVSNVEDKLQTEIVHYARADGSTQRVPIKPLVVPPELGIVAIQGVASHPPVSPRFARSNMSLASMKPFAAKQIRSGYNLPAASLGSGQAIGLIELDGYEAKDVAQYASRLGLPQPTLTNILLDGFDGKPSDGGGQVEVTMDIELIHAMAPHAAELRIYAAGNAGNSWYDLWNEIANPTQGDKKLIKYISCSWGSPENENSPASVRAENLIFKQMAAQGQTVFAAAGDDGAYDDGRHLVTDNPASQPYVVGVGGTQLQLDPNGQWAKETTWTHGGGGASCYWRLPSWQQGLQTKSNKGSPSMRNVPDVSANADPQTGYYVYVSGGWQIIGGTSAAAPLWTGLAALINERRVSVNKAPIGWFTPYLYTMARGNGYGIAMHDIADGSKNGYYPASAGFDEATGWGSFNGNIISVLEGAR